MLEDNKEQPWQFGFYNKSKDKVITFIVHQEKIEMQEEEEIFKKPDTKIKQIDIEKITISFKEILKKTEEFIKKKYPKELSNKTIAILQGLDKYGTVWNLTYITHSFNTINIKASPEDGKILHDKIESIMGFIKK
ncbi:MAG: hypothetical protein CL471_18165 [Acidobacteria bacterium]|nr:hypothetical protein [Acidobacteriota bacterium]